MFIFIREDGGGACATHKHKLGENHEMAFDIMKYSRARDEYNAEIRPWGR